EHGRAVETAPRRPHHALGPRRAALGALDPFGAFLVLALAAVVFLVAVAPAARPVLLLFVAPSAARAFFLLLAPPPGPRRRTGSDAVVGHHVDVGVFLVGGDEEHVGAFRALYLLASQVVADLQRRVAAGTSHADRHGIALPRFAPFPGSYPVRQP